MKIASVRLTTTGAAPAASPINVGKLWTYPSINNQTSPACSISDAQKAKVHETSRTRAIQSSISPADDDQPLPKNAKRLQPLSMRSGLAIIAILLISGCSAKLETGYDPHKIGSTSDERRGFYAAPFSPEAQNSGENQDSFRARRPNQY
jgi:hypothetical protein